MPSNDIELTDKAGNKVTVTRAHYERWKHVLEKEFRPVAEKKTAALVVTNPAPTGEHENKEN